MKFLALLVGVLVLCGVSPAWAHAHNRPPPSTAGLADATVLIVRHAEDAETGQGLSPTGELRARAYARYFYPFTLGQRQLRVDALVAAADTRASHRPRLTLEPLGRTTGLPIQQPFESGEASHLVAWLGQGAPGRTILIAWHHGDVPKLLRAFGIDPSGLLHRDHWPGHIYDWVIVLRFDSRGAIMPASGVIREPDLIGSAH